ncbi:MAG: tRNA (guanine-N7-)-methyltransferase [Polaribacter sp.]|jgi:tRNA (guanine-N7-)-methyltransferase
MSEFHRKIKSFVKREGRMTLGQRLAYEAMMPKYGLQYKKEILDFKALFGNDNPVCLEIGFGMGSSLAEQALMHPDRNYIGIEVHKPGVGALLLRVQENAITNIRVMSHDAVEALEDMIEDDSLSLIQLFFPDPWHKRKHHKRRIVQVDFVMRLFSKLKESGHFHMATDWQDYAKHMLKIMLECINIHSEAKFSPTWSNCSDSNDYIPKPDDRPMTKFQKRGEKLGHGVWDLLFSKTRVY